MKNKWARQKNGEHHYEHWAIKKEGVWAPNKSRVQNGVKTMNHDMSAELCVRWVITHINTYGLRTMTFALQGRNTHATKEEAEKTMVALLDVERNQNDISGVYGVQAVGTFEVRPIECWPNHFDPKGRYFERTV